MGKSKIEWTEYTFNPWVGCAKVSPGCRGCYAQSHDIRWNKGVNWGEGAPRKFQSEKYWSKLWVWNASAKKKGIRERVFVASLADVFERHSDPAINTQMNLARQRLYGAIEECTNLIFLLLTKRPENIASMIPGNWLEPDGLYKADSLFWGEVPANVMFMTSIENQDQVAKRIPHLMRLPAKIGLSVEPLIREVNLDRWLKEWLHCPVCNHISPSDEWTKEYPFIHYCPKCGEEDTYADQHRRIGWVIVGGESGKKARPMNIRWPLIVKSSCVKNRTSFMFKQWGEWYGCFDSHPVTEDIMNAKEVITFDDGENVSFSYKIGKKKAGRLLLGEQYDGHPFNLDSDTGTYYSIDATKKLEKESGDKALKTALEKALDIGRYGRSWIEIPSFDE